MTPLDELPPETVHRILFYIPSRRDLASFCLASQSCYQLGFSELYRILYFGQASHVENIILRIATENNLRPALAGSLRAAPCVRHLIFDDERYAKDYDREQLICEDIVTRLTVNLVPYLTELESLSWKSHWLPRNTKIFKAFRTCCPKLSSVEIFNHLYSISDESASYTNSLYGFKNLQHMSIIAEHVSFGRQGVPPPIIQMIRSSPKLHSLELILEGAGTWSPNKLIESVDLVFANLHTIRFSGPLTKNWPILFSRPSQFTLFFQQHRSLHTISLPWMPNLENSYAFGPEQMAELFPSLRHFEGPSFLCLAIATSSLSSQLETIKMLDLSSPSTLVRDDRPSGEALCNLAASVVALPALRRFQFLLDPKARLSRIVHDLTQAAPELRELAMDNASLKQLKISESLHSPNLRKLTIRAGLISPNILRTLLNACPRLEELHDTYNSRLAKTWKVSRRADGVAELK